MSNLIKYYTFHVTEDEKRLVESDEKVDGFIPGILAHGEVEIRDLAREEFDQDFPEEMFEDNESKQESAMSEETLEQANEQAGMLLEEAQKEAKKLIEQAKVSAEFEKEKILEESKKAGYRDGLVQANDELASQRKELEERKEQLELEYRQLVDELEPNFVRIVMGLVKKLTGILVEDKKDIILYLMEQSLKNLGKTSSLVIRVSEADIEMVEGAQERIAELISDNCELEIVMDSSLEQNQCIIEADKQIIDCSLDVQMKGLMEDLKMMM